MKEKGETRKKREGRKSALCQAPCRSDCAASRLFLVRLRRDSLRSVAHLVFSYTSVTSCCKLHRSNWTRKGDQRGAVTWGYRTSKRARAHQKTAASMDLLLPAWSGCMQNTREVTSSYVVVGSWFSLFPSFTYLTSRQNITGSAPRANSFHPPTPRLSPSFS